MGRSRQDCREHKNGTHAFIRASGYVVGEQAPEQRLDWSVQTERTGFWYLPRGSNLRGV